MGISIDKKRRIQSENRPQAGSTIIVEPIRDLKDIKSIKRLLADRPRDLCLFITGINTNLRASDLLRIRAGQVRNMKTGDEILINETKTKKPRMVTLNKSVIDSIQRLLNSREYEDSEPLFIGQRGGNALTVTSVNRLVKSWCRAINLKGNYGSHTLRKTFGYHQRVTYGMGLPELTLVFNHSSQRQTLSYLCIQDEEVKSIYMNEL